MSPSDPRLTSAPSAPAAPARRAVILTSYQTGATRGKNLGVPGYSYDIVAQLYVPLLARWGEVIQVGREAGLLEAAVGEARRRGLDPVHVSLLPFQDFCLTPSAPNVIVPAWEFPDVPDHVFDGNPHNDWVATAHKCDVVIVGGQFTVDALRRAGVRTPIRVVPVPTPDDYFGIEGWRPDRQVRIPCPAYVFPHPDVPADALWDAPQILAPGGRRPGGAAEVVRSLKGQLREKARLAYRNIVKPLVPPAVHGLLKAVAGRDAWDAYVRQCRRTHLDLSGVVYVSIFNPADRRKNWDDLLTGFTTALRDCPDATLVVKLITRQQVWIDRILAYYRRVGLAHRCKVAFITDYLPHQQMLDLVRAGAYYLTTTRGEGNCLPVMNYLAAGRPCVSPCHTAIGDYFTNEMGFIIDTHPEPAIWPHDGRLRFKTTWGRLVWPSLVEQLRRSYQVARNDRAAYEAMAAAGRNKMAQWASAESIWPRLRAALDLVDQVRARNRAA